MPWGWTWGDCRLAHLEGTLEAEDRILCNARFRAVAANYRYGIHWIYMGYDQQTIDTYPDTQLGDVNAIYAPSSMRFFFSASRTRIMNPVVSEGGRGRTQFTFRDAVPRHSTASGHRHRRSRSRFTNVHRTSTRRGRDSRKRRRGGLMGRQLTLHTRWTNANY